MSSNRKLRRLTLIWAVDEGLNHRFSWSDLLKNYDQHDVLLTELIKELLGVMVSKKPSLKRFSTKDHDVSSDDLWTLFNNTFIQGQYGLETIEVNGAFRSLILEQLHDVMVLESSSSVREDLDRFQHVVGKAVCRYVDALDHFLRKKLRSDSNLEWLGALQLDQDIHHCDTILSHWDGTLYQQKYQPILNEWKTLLSD